ncbi:hypothetical protein RJ640_003089 [Escallonia rubra]|uniref:Uncharacterized protein n=1 Tax=Escallonia rubra TaxID=112253 RepID=A0AA88R442_9ASTE|nr:hypothetical protein RJ640_003089 [Escallonia rubra]
MAAAMLLEMFLRRPAPVSLDKAEIVAYNFFSGFSQECAKLYFRNVGFDFSVNCIPGRIATHSTKPLVIPILSAKPLVCGTLLETQKTSPSPSPS